MITLETKNYEKELGYMGFACLRSTIAGLFAPELKDLYVEYCMRELPSYSGEKYELENKRIREEYETKVNKICYKNPDHEKVFDFLHMCDCEGKIDSDICRAIWEVIKDHNDNENYGGYYGTDEPFTFFTFKKLIKDGIDSKKGVKWY